MSEMGKDDKMSSLKRNLCNHGGTHTGAFTTVINSIIEIIAH